MEPFFRDDLATIYHGDCREVMKTFPENSIDTILTDPPYGLKFMGKDWDHGVPGVHYWAEAFRVAKPGAFLLAFGGTRTYHRLTCAVEDAGWEIRDCIMWLYGSGFPKSHDISKAIDKNGGKSVSWFVEYIEHVCKERGIHNREITALFPSKNGGMTGWFWNKRKGKQNITPEQFNRIRDFLGLPFADLQEAEREVIGEKSAGLGSGNTYAFRDENKDAPRKVEITAPATQAAQAWHGWGTALKPAWEPIIIAMKPLDKTFINNALTWDVAGLNIDGCRIQGDANYQNGNYNYERKKIYGQVYGWKDSEKFVRCAPHNQGRWPANVIFDEPAAEMLDEQSGILTSGGTGGGGNTFHGQEYKRPQKTREGDSGGASRFFYTAKAAPNERGEDNNHPTVKPLDLMKYLCKLTATPSGGVILDPFMGSGTTLLAAREMGRKSIGIEIDLHSCQIAKNRMKQGMLNFAG